MRREMVQSAPKGAWKTAFKQVVKPGVLAGLNALDGNHAVGWNGEVWLRDGANWSQLESPTKQILTGVLDSEEHGTIVCGRNGSLFVLGKGKWTEVKAPKVDFWRITEFAGTVYLSTMSEVFTLSKNKLTPVKWGKTRPRTCYQVVVGGDSLWSVGEKDAWRLVGKSWSKVL